MICLKSFHGAHKGNIAFGTPSVPTADRKHYCCGCLYSFSSSPNGCFRRKYTTIKVMYGSRRKNDARFALTKLNIASGKNAVKQNLYYFSRFFEKFLERTGTEVSGFWNYPHLGCPLTQTRTTGQKDKPPRTDEYGWVRIGTENTFVSGFWNYPSPPLLDGASG